MSHRRTTITAPGVEGFESEVVTPAEVEIIWRIPRSSQKKQRALGTFVPHYYVGRRVYYRRAAVEQWVQDQENATRGAFQ